MAGTCICKTCGHVGKQKTETPGKFWVELFLWLCLIIPGIIYSVWRISARRKVCPKCRERGMIPLNSPFGQDLAKRVYQMRN